jgi:hypothetical protein
MTFINAFSGIDASKVVLMGDSCGGNLAAAATALHRDDLEVDKHSFPGIKAQVRKCNKEKRKNEEKNKKHRRIRDAILSSQHCNSCTDHGMFHTFP